MDMMLNTTTPGASVAGRGAPSGAPAFCKTEKSVVLTNVYIDGFNFYYGELRHSQFKWLNIQDFFSRVLGQRHQIGVIKLFTAKVQDRQEAPGSAKRQDTYLKTLGRVCPKVEIIYGHFLRHCLRMENADPPPSTVRVWKTEEKGSDVNLAVHLLNDGWRNSFDCAVVVSNDSDLASSMELVRKECRKSVGLITPGAPLRRTSFELRKHADFIRQFRRWHFEASLLPESVPDTTLHKPADW